MTAVSLPKTYPKLDEKHDITEIVPLLYLGSPLVLISPYSPIAGVFFGSFQLVRRFSNSLRLGVFGSYRQHECSS
jgi:hypothetical protein